MEVLRNFNARELFRKLEMPDNDFEDWLIDLGLLHRTRTCDVCHSAMNQKWREGERYPSWKCGACHAERGYLTGTLFEGSHLSLKDIFQLSYYWCRQTHTQEEIIFDMQRWGSAISRMSITGWNKLFREICINFFVTNPIKIGGPGKVVEVDETVITKRKYNRGRLVANQQWVFGGVERGTGHCFLVPIERKDADTLLPIITEHILPETTIMSDSWAAYGGIERLGCFFRHLTVNHSVNFVDPDTGAHTQTIEGTWSHFKARHKEERGTSRALFGSYVTQFVWRKHFKGHDVMYHLWSQIKALYKL